MRAGKKLERETSVHDQNGNRRFRITPQTKVADVLTHYPQSLQVFLRHGFGPLASQSGAAKDHGARGHDRAGLPT
jgi:hypothetical protein